jgi:hypothetical protein
MIQKIDTGFHLAANAVGVCAEIMLNQWHGLTACGSDSIGTEQVLETHDSSVALVRKVSSRTRGNEDENF